MVIPVKLLGSPAIALNYITEFTNPKNDQDHPMYTCSLPGCKSAWGTSDDMVHHVQNSKHQKNFFKLKFPEDPRITSLTEDEILRKASAQEDDMGGPEARDYGRIKSIDDVKRYEELRNRRRNWSEKKAQLGLVGGRSDSNEEHLVKRKASVQRSSESLPQFQDQFDEEVLPTKRRVDQFRHLRHVVEDKQTVKLRVREEAIRKYEEEMIEEVKDLMGNYKLKVPEKFESLHEFAVHTVKNKILEPEVKLHSTLVERGEMSWHQFQVSVETKENVPEYLMKLDKRRP